MLIRHKAAKKLADEGSPGTNKLNGFKTSFPLISIKFFLPFLILIVLYYA